MTPMPGLRARFIRRAWLLLEDMKLSFDQPLAMSSVGGPGGGGVVITEFGERLIADYRQLEAGLRQLAEKHLHDVRSHVKATRSKPVVHSTSIKRKSTASE
jgi:molybdate transport repressor ModE-like protein